MTGRDLLCAIAGIDDGIVSASGQFSAVESSIKAERKRAFQRFAAIGIAAALCIAVFGVMKLTPEFPRFFAPSDTTEIQTPEGPDSSEARDIAVVTEPRTTGDEGPDTIPFEEQAATAVSETEIPSTSAVQASQTVPASDPEHPETQPPPTEAPSSTNTQEAPAFLSEVPSSAEPSAEPTSVSPTTVQNPDAQEDVYQDLVVDYETAKNRFEHPIRSCERSDFTNYRVVIVSPGGDIDAGGAYCLSVTYVFTNGYVDLRDQNRMTEGIIPTGHAYEYQGRTFYVHEPAFNGDRIRVEYFPAGKSGIAYQAGFDKQSGAEEIMDLILSVEI